MSRPRVCTTTPTLTAEGVVAAAREGDALALAALAETARWLGITFATVVAVVNPAMIIVGGGLGLSAYDLLVPGAEAELHRRVLPPSYSRLRIVPSQVHHSAVGASALVWHHQEGALMAAETPVALTEQVMAVGLAELIANDSDLAEVHERLGPPPLWARPRGFPTLVHIILEQQVSLASARATFDRLREAVSPLTPEGFLQLDDETLLAIGFSRQKRRYCRHLAEALIAGDLDLDALETLDDDQVRRSLIALKGIGPWSAEIYLLMALGRADAWPAGDLALAVAAQEVKGLDGRPDPAMLTELAEAWRPWRAVAARLLWHHYLSKPTG